MGCVNYTAISGNLVGAPEIKATKNGSYLVEFRVAVNEGYGDKQRVSFFGCVRFLGSNPSEAALRFWQGLEKGRRVFVTGKMRQDRWEKDGAKHERWELIADELDTLGRPAVDPSSYASGQQLPIAAAPPQMPAPEVYDEDIPF